MPTIELAYKYHCDKLRLCYGSNEPDTPTPEAAPPSGKDVFAVLRSAATPPVIR